MARKRRRGPVERAESSQRQFLKRIPKDVLANMAGEVVTLHAGPRVVNIVITPSTQSIRFSLRTGDPRTARLWEAQALAELETIFAGYRQEAVIELSHRQIVALCGELYARWARHPEEYDNFQLEYERDATGKLVPGVVSQEPELEEVEAEWASGSGRAAFQEYALGLSGEGLPHDDVKFGKLGQKLLLGHGIRKITPSSNERLVAALRRTYADAIKTLHKVASGDLSPDPLLSRFVPFELEGSQKPAPSLPLGPLSLKGLLESWWADAKANGASANTYEGFKSHIRQFTEFLGHDDARVVTNEDIVNFRDHKLTTPSPRTKKPISAKSFKAGALVTLTSVFAWAVTEKLLSASPVEGVVVRVRKQARLRQRDFTEEEATLILKATLTVQPVANSQFYKRDLANQWIPWLCAYSGARVGEIVQLRKQDIKQGPHGHYLNVTPEAGTVKTKEFREVPIHEHLIAMGFLDLVSNAKAGYLFIDPKSPDVVHTAIATRSARLRDFVRGAGITDPNVQPNHGWRHTFKTVCTEVGVEEKVQDAICGHAPRTTGGKYGTVPLKAKATAMKLFPRYEVALENGDATN